MNIKISDEILLKIKKLWHGILIANKLKEITTRPNTAYNRGIVHGYLLVLTDLGVISFDEARSILEQIER